MRISFKGNRPWENPAHMAGIAPVYGGTYRDRIRALLKKDAVILDTETTGLEENADIVGFSFSYESIAFLAASKLS